MCLCKEVRGSNVWYNTELSALHHRRSCTTCGLLKHQVKKMQPSLTELLAQRGRTLQLILCQVLICTNLKACN